ncbi:MAG: TonB-dependent receptor plug domain-containing protein [Mediterranea sp.]|nr:TonB-dependent receptor plug domain-containing protein [Mediterranea sp.]
MRTFALLLGCLLLYVPNLSAQTLSDTIVANFSLLQRMPQEKLYLHLDKPFYGAGEKLWFKGYLLNATTHREDTKSNFIITELINRSDSVVLRKKVRRDSLGVFSNAFTLPATLPAGDYYLRGYTEWMRNAGPDFFYTRDVTIGNAIDNTILSSIEYEEVDSTLYTARVSFYDNNRAPYADTHIRYRLLIDGKPGGKGRRTTDANGTISLPLPGDALRRARRELLVEFDDPKLSYTKTFYLPTFDKEFGLSFFPEGGALLAISHQTVAFKAVKADGSSLPIEGDLLNAAGDTLAHFQSEHDGMGVFVIMRPSPDETYSVAARSADGIIRRFKLPKVEPKGISINVSYHRQEIRYEIQKTDSTPWPEPLFLAAHTRGKLSLLRPIGSTAPIGRLDENLFDPGITHFMLVDGQGKVLSERLLFVPDKKPLQWQVSTDKRHYGRREKVELSLSVTDADGQPVEGDFSISVTDRQMVQPDSLADNSLSNLLLTSDLKGYIENPGFYFLDQSPRTLRCVDYLMLTHGWRRYRVDNLVRPFPLDFTYYVERGQTISGHVKGLFGGNVKRGPITILSPKRQIFETTNTDDKGDFLTNILFPDSTTFVVQARTKKGFASVDIEMDESPLPPATHRGPFADRSVLISNDYLAHAREKYYMEGGMRVYNLKEVVVSGKRESPSQQSVYVQGSMNVYTVEGEELDRFSAQNAFDVATRLPGVTVWNGNEIHVRNNESPALLVVDDITYEDNSLLRSIPTSQISSVNLIRGADSAIFGLRGAGGAIVITLKRGAVMPAAPPRGITIYSPLGYCQPVEFFSPAYPYSEHRNWNRPDTRTTIYWNPSVKLDAEGKATLSYYTPDSTAPEEVVIEGVTKDGKVCRLTRTVNP